MEPDISEFMKVVYAVAIKHEQELSQVLPTVQQQQPMFYQQNQYIPVKYNPFEHYEQSSGSTQQRFLSSPLFNEQIDLDTCKKRKFSETEEKQINYVGEFYGLIREIISDFPEIERMIISDKHIFKHFIRESESIERLFKRMKYDLDSIYNTRYNMCYHTDSCTRTELCAFLHIKDIDAIKIPFRELQKAIKTYTSIQREWTASIVMRHIQELNNGIWYTYSRKKLGKDILYNNKNVNKTSN
jgi:hypothetical protein